MNRTILPNNKSVHEQYQQEETTRETNIKKISSNVFSENSLITAAGGSINQLPIKTEAFKKWMTDLHKKNIFIGKSYINSASEYNSEQIKLDEHVLSGKTGMKCASKLEHNILNPIITKDMEKESHLDPLKCDTNNTSVSFMDSCIINNTVRLEFENHGNTISSTDIHKSVEKALQKYHNDNTYQSTINLDTFIKQVSTKYLSNEKKMLK